MKALLKFKDEEETKESFEDEEHLKYEFGDETDIGTTIDDAIAIFVRLVGRRRTETSSGNGKCFGSFCVVERGFV